MVCAKCEKKLSRLACPDKWKTGARNTMANPEVRSSVGKDKRLGKKERFNPLGAKCKACRASVHQFAIYCHMCAYKKGICAGCGKQVLDTKGYRQSGV